MYRMRYNCDAESYAQQHVLTCNRRQTRPRALGGFKENVNVLDRKDTTLEGAVQWAMYTWSSQLTNRGVPSNMIYSREVADRPISNGVSAFTKMAWSSNTQLGCAVNDCGSFFFTSCIYGPGGGNNIGQSIYPIGAVCSQCTANCTDGLCPTP
ncbi:unnamed protein product [Strongylus vulgaris]|uniref:SCP domain-containing protein n=1 Tax=Strongylus vulgaris TaxID=40348 RepID=A0A3P7IKD0_STRVU|nr:unnamed protein product [Strongylus vulgaris]